jgi:glycosyltransferase 2 family protein
LASIWRIARQWLPGIIVSVLAFLFIFQLANWNELGPALVAVQWKFLAPAVAVFFVSMLARAFAWWILLQRKAPYIRTVFILNEGYLLNNLLPFRLGELGRAVLMGQVTQTSPFYVLSTIMMERAFDLAIAASLLLYSIPLVLEINWARPLALTTLGTVVVGFFFLYILSITRARWLPNIEEKISHGNTLIKKLWPWFRSLLDGFSILANPLQFLFAAGGMLTSWGLAIYQYKLLLTAVTPGIQAWWPVFVLGVAAFGVALPSAPGSLGVFEASVVGALALVGISAASALTYAVALHLIHFVITGIIGIIGLYQEGETISSIYQRLVHSRAEGLV